MASFNVIGKVINSAGLDTGVLTGTITMAEAPVGSMSIAPAGPQAPGTVFTITYNVTDPLGLPLTYEVPKVNGVNATPTAAPNVFTW